MYLCKLQNEQRCAFHQQLLHYMHVNGCEDLPSRIIQRLLQTVDKAFPFASFRFVSSMLLLRATLL